MTADLTPALRLTLVTLGVTDVARATRFYEAIGLKRSSASNDEVSFFEAGGVALALFARDDLAKDAGVSADGNGFRALSLAWNCGSDQEVDEAVGRMLAAGARSVKTPAPTFWGGYAGYAEDPDGHLWEVAHNPHWPFDADGRMRLPT